MRRLHYEMDYDYMTDKRIRMNMMQSTSDGG
jgi:hypothetical protein